MVAEKEDPYRTDGLLGFHMFRISSTKIQNRYFHTECKHGPACMHTYRVMRMIFVDRKRTASLRTCSLHSTYRMRRLELS
jgi:hypothetical protein